MGKATGVFLILAGVGTAALVLPAVDKDAERQLADVVRIATNSTQRTTPDQGTRVVAPIVTAATVPPTQRLPARAPSAAETVVAVPGMPDRVASTSSDIGQVPMLVVPPQLVTKNGVAAPAKLADAKARQGLTRDIQRELKRVGCYDGEMSGEWTPATRRAMKLFIDRVNAALPIEEPDHILRTMVQGHPGSACGQACPSGQTASTDGRCLPSAVVAQNGATRPVIRPSDATQREPTVVPRDVASAQPVVPKPAWETTVAGVPAKPFTEEGRMAIGGPIGGVPAAAAAAVAPVDIGPRTCLTPTATSAAAATAAIAARCIVPGAIAALSQGAAVAGSAGPRQDKRSGVPVAAPAAIAPADATELAGTPAVVRRQQAAAEPRRERAVPVRRPPPTREVFKFPAPSGYLGGTVKYGTAYSSERSSFSRIFDRLERDRR